MEVQIVCHRPPPETEATLSVLVSVRPTDLASFTSFVLACDSFFLGFLLRFIFVSLKEFYNSCSISSLIAGDPELHVLSSKSLLQSVLLCTRLKNLNMYVFGYLNTYHTPTLAFSPAIKSLHYRPIIIKLT